LGDSGATQNSGIAKVISDSVLKPTVVAEADPLYSGQSNGPVLQDDRNNKYYIANGKKKKPVKLTDGETSYSSTKYGSSFGQTETFIPMLI
jgi:hypothetical protein